MTSPRLLICRASLSLLLTLFTVVSALGQTSAQRRVCTTLLQLNNVCQISLDKGARGGLSRVATLRKQIMGQSPNK